MINTLEISSHFKWQNGLFCLCTSKLKKKRKKNAERIKENERWNNNVKRTWNLKQYLHLVKEVHCLIITILCIFFFRYMCDRQRLFMHWFSVTLHWSIYNILNCFVCNVFLLSVYFMSNWPKIEKHLIFDMVIIIHEPIPAFKKKISFCLQMPFLWRSIVD